MLYFAVSLRKEPTAALHPPDAGAPEAQPSSISGTAKIGHQVGEISQELVPTQPPGLIISRLVLTSLVPCPRPLFSTAARL